MDSFGTNDAPIQSAMISGVIDGLYQQRDLFYDLQFSSLAEQVVLRDKLVVVRNEDSNHQPSVGDDNNSMAEEVIDAWAADGAISYESITDTALEVSRRTDPFAIASKGIDETKPEKTMDEYLDAPDTYLGSAIGNVVGRDMDDSEAVELEDFLRVAKELGNAAVLAAIKN